MIYVALLRGINVGGNNKVDMKQLKAAFERAGMTEVSTYINSGNVIFRDDNRLRPELVKALEAEILKVFDLSIKVLLRSFDEMKAINAALPADWTNDDQMKSDVMYLWEEVDLPEVMERLVIKPGIDTVKYVPGAVIWGVARKNVTRSGLMKIVGTDLYKQMTVRNCNTARKLFEKMGQLS